jgi:hypothetical protein
MTRHECVRDETGPIVGVWLLAVLLASPLGACRGSGGALPPAGDPGAVVAAFFAAAAARDCDDLAQASAGELRARVEASCEAALAEIEHVGYELLAVLGDGADGRAAAARLVLVRVARAGKVSERIIRVEVEAGAWGVTRL